jgi:hypothetical protein
MPSHWTALQSALLERRKLIDEWKTIGQPTPQDLLDRIDENDRRILLLGDALLTTGGYGLPN